MRSLVSTILCCCLTAMLGGCGQSEELLPTIPVSGTVTLNDAPLKQARILFVPVAEGAMAANGTTDDAGHYELNAGNNIGALPGEYKVVVEAWVMRDGKPVVPGPDMDVEQLRAAGQLRSALPTRYSSPQLTELTAKVPAEESSTELNFALTSK